MGMDLYNTAAHAVWKGADVHLLAVYEFSIVEIVKDNPKEKTIHFGGIKGQAILTRSPQHYMARDMTYYDAMDKDVPSHRYIKKDLDRRLSSYIYSEHISSLELSAKVVVGSGITTVFLSERHRDVTAPHLAGNCP